MRILTIYPYLLDHTWVFDDAATGLKEEAFVLGMSAMISRFVEYKKIPSAALGFALQFSDEPFEGFDAHLDWGETGDSQTVPGQDGSASYFGNWYTGMVAGRKMTGWLCPALGLYFYNAPKRLFVKVEPLPAGVQPIWRISRDDAKAKRFVSAPKSDNSRTGVPT
jgi:hypothetical protein